MGPDVCEVILRSGDFCFRLHRCWAKWPGDMDNRAVSGIAEHPDGLIYVSTRSRRHPVCVFDREGNCVRTFGEGLDFQRTHGLTVDLDGTLWICDDSQNVVFQLDCTGNLLRMMGERGVGSDSGYDPSVRWPHDLYTVTRAGEPFNRPTRMMQSPWGDRYCTDGYGNAAVHRFSADGRLICTWGGPGRGFGKFRLPHGIAADPMERLWICDRENFMVQLFDKEGNYLTQIAPAGYPSEIWNCGDYMYLCDADGMAVIYGMDCRAVAVIGYPGCFAHVHSIGGDRDGNLYLGRIDDGDDTLFQLEKI